MGQIYEWKGTEDALQRIENIRQGQIMIQVVDTRNQPIPTAQVSLEMIRNEFNFGAAIGARYSFDSNGPLEAEQLYLNTFKENFNAAVIENALKWTFMEDEKGNINHDIIERSSACLEWLSSEKIPVRGHNVIWPSWENMPAYLKDFEPNPDRIREVVKNRFQHILSLYSGSLMEWDLVNEPAHHRDLLNIFGESELAQWFQMAKDIDPETPLYINQWYALNGTYHEEYLRLLRDLVITDTPLDGIGLQGHLFVDQLTSEEGLSDIWTKLNQYAALGLPIKITEMDINGDQGEELQARALENALTLFYSHPAVEGVMLWGFWQGHHWRGNEKAELWWADGTPKAAALTWQKLVNDEWKTLVSGKTDTNGHFLANGYTGSYQITVSNGNSTEKRSINLTPNGTELKIILPSD